MIADDIKDEHRKILFKLMDKYGKNNLIIHFFDMESSFNNAYSDSRVSKVGYYRIKLPSLLPNLDKVIYSDVDVINFEDLYGFYNLNFNKNIYFRGILDYTRHIKSLVKYNINTTKYMNDGIMLIKLKDIRKDGIEQKIIDFVKNHKFLELYDQTAINAVCNNNFEKLPLKYARFNFLSIKEINNYNNKQDERYRYSEKEVNEAFFSPIMIHYAGSIKPWIKGKICYDRGYWWYYVKKTEYYEELLKQYNFTNEEVMELIKIDMKNNNYIRKNKYK